MLTPGQTRPTPPVPRPTVPDRMDDGTSRKMETDQRQVLFKLSQFIWLSFGVLEGLIGLRILLRLMAANPASPFARLVYEITQPFLAPFAGLTATPAANGVVLEVSSIVALFVYALLSVLIERLFWILFSRSSV
jgi:YggT family protein